MQHEQCFERPPHHNQENSRKRQTSRNCPCLQGVEPAAQQQHNPNPADNQQPKHLLAQRRVGAAACCHRIDDQRPRIPPRHKKDHDQADGDEGGDFGKG